MSSFFLNKPGSNNGGGEGNPVSIVDNLTSNSKTSALSANQGRVLDEKIKDHEKVIASTTKLGHVKVDGSTITIDPVTGIISSTATGGDSVSYAQAVLPTTVVNQTKWKIPFSNYKHPDDLLIVTFNSAVVNTDIYSISQNIDGVSWDVNIPITPPNTRPIASTKLFVIMVKGGSGGSGGGGSSITIEDVLTSTSTLNALSANMGRELKELLGTHEQLKASKTILGHVKIDDSTIKMASNGEIYAENAGEITKLESYQKVLETTTVNQKEWIIPLQSFDPDNDTIIVSHNTTLLTDEMYEIYTDGAFKGIRILGNISSEIADNNVFIIILRNVITDGTNMISGSIILDKTITEDKLSQDVQDKLNSSGGGGGGNISADSIIETANRVFVTPVKSSAIDSHTNEIASQTTRIATVERDLATLSTTDELVKMDANGVAGYLSELIDGLTISNVNGNLQVQNLNNLLSTITELNSLQGITSNVQSQINNLSGVSVFRGVFNTLANLEAASDPLPGQYAIVSEGGTSSYYYFYSGSWQFSHDTSTSSDIDINSGTVGILNKTRYEKQNAVETSFTDPTGKIIATNTNAAIVEVFRFADSLLKGLTQTVGSPLSANDTIESNLSNFKLWWASLANAITLKGSNTSPSNNGNEIISKIGSIPNINVNGSVKKTSKLNITAPYDLKIPLNASIPLIDVTSTLFEFIHGNTGVVLYDLNFNNGDAKDFIPNNMVDFDGVMKLKKTFLYPMEKDDSWSGVGNLYRKKITSDDWSQIKSLRLVVK